MSSLTASGKDIINCARCDVTFSTKTNMYRHVRKFHPTENITLPGNICCCICAAKFQKLDQLHQHIKTDHLDFHLHFSEQIFFSRNDFDEWKAKIEKDTTSHFMLNGPVHTLFDGRLVETHVCHRSGPSDLIKTERKRRLKRGGSIKIGKTCPASMKVYVQTVEEAQEIKIVYQSVHFGHDMKVGVLPLAKEVKCFLAGQMDLGVPKSKVLRNVWKQFSPTKRESVINRQDLTNICRDYKIDEGVTFHQNDAMSVDIKVKKMQKEEDNPVIIYKAVDEPLIGYPDVSKQEFLLALMNDAQLTMLKLYGNEVIMIDSTHGLNKYGYQLTTLMVNDDNHEGFPVAVLFSTRTASESYVPFFEAIKSRAPDIKPKVFMSDDAPAFYNAWKLVFGDVDQYLLCSWHVWHSWNAQLHSKIKDFSLRSMVKKALQGMMHEIDETTFKALAEFHIPQFLADADTKDFGEYMQKYYMDRVEQWAYCYRAGSTVNTNMKLERWHRELKYEEASNKIIKRLDHGLSLVLSAVSKKIVGRIVSLERNKLPKRNQEIRKRHDKSKILDAKSIIEMEPRKSWVYVKPSTSDSLFLNSYDINFVRSCSCNIRCDDCNICIHSLSCTCHDYLIRFQLCKHIHLVCQHFKYGEEAVASNEMDNGLLYIDVCDRDVNRDQEQRAHVKEIKKCKLIENQDEKRAAVRLKFENLMQRSKTDEQLNTIFESLKTVEARFEAATEAEKHFPAVPKHISQQPANKSIQPQRRFITVKSKKRKLQSSKP